MIAACYLSFHDSWIIAGDSVCARQKEIKDKKHERSNGMERNNMHAGFYFHILNPKPALMSPATPGTLRKIKLFFLLANRSKIDLAIRNAVLIFYFFPPKKQ
jgi:hypothetical protein